MNTDAASGYVVAVCSSPRHGFSKWPQGSIRLLPGCGVEGDAHCGTTVQHLYLKRRNPVAANRMQVHLLQSELFDQLTLAAMHLQPGHLGENVTTRNIDLLNLPLGALLHLGEDAVVELTGLRTPCKKIDDFCPGLLDQVSVRVGRRIVSGRVGVMGVVLHGGIVAPAAPIRVTLPDGPFTPMRMI